MCGKCGKGMEGGFGPKGDDSLARGLKQALRHTGRRQSVQVIETKCMGLCPHGAVTLLRGSAPGVLVAVPPGADLEALLTEG